MTKTPVKSLSYRPDIDGLRALAVFAVFIFHAFPEVMCGGFVGVDVFFVISGFLISSIIFSQLENGSFSFWNFYSRRIRRIYPVLITVLSVCLVAGWFLLFHDQFSLLGKHVAGGAAFVSNLLLRREHGYFDTAANLKPLLHLWSLGIEEQFYIIWPLLAWLVWKKRFSFLWLTVCIAAISFGFNVVYWYKMKEAHDFFFPQARFWELLCGALLAWISLHCQSFVPKEGQLQTGETNNNGAIWMSGGICSHILSACGAILLVVATFITPEKGFPGFWALLPVLATVFLIAAGKDGCFNNRILSSRILVWFGLISYPLYLWHWPLLCLIRIAYQGEPPFWMNLVIFPVCILLAWLTTKFIENPLRFGIHGNVKTAGLFIVMIIVGTVGFTIYKKNGFPSRWPDAINQIAEIRHKSFKTNSGYRNGCDNGRYASCPDLGKHLAKPTIAILGDSFASHMVPGIKNYLGDEWNIWQRSKAACPPIFNGIENDPSCRTTNQNIFKEILENRPEKVVLVGNWEAYSSYRDVEQTIKQLKQNKINDIVLIGLLPTWGESLPTKMIWTYTKTHSFPTRIPAQINLTVENDLARIAQRNQVNYISLVNLLCNTEGCLTMGNNGPGSIYYFDEAHLTESGSNYLGSILSNDPIFDTSF